MSFRQSRNVMGGDGEKKRRERPTASVRRPTDQREGAINMIPDVWQIGAVVTALASIICLNEAKQLTPLVCNSVNDLQAINEQTDFVYVTTRGKECTFVFEGPPEAQLDIKVHSFSGDSSAKNACKNPPVRLFAYSKKNKLRQLEKVLCAEDDSVRTVTDTNTAIVSSTLRYGSFFVRVRPLSSLTSRVIIDRTKLINNYVTQKRPDVTPRRRNDLIRLTSDFSDQADIGGMFPPDLQSVDFFATMNQFEIPLRFRAKPQGFVPSAYYPSPGNPRPTDSYGAPVTSGPILWGPYTGRPGLQIDITSTQTPVEWVTGNITFTGPESSMSFTGYPENPQTTEGYPGGSSRATEATTTVEPTRYTEPLTSPSALASTEAQTPAPLSAATPEKVTDGTSNVEITNTNSTTITETEFLSNEAKQLQKRTIDNTGGFKPVVIVI